jgi:hypothetical protein
VCIGAEWHPSDPNMVVTCGWEGQVKLWQWCGKKAEKRHKTSHVIEW